MTFDIGKFIIPTDEVHDFSEGLVCQHPPTRYGETHSLEDECSESMKNKIGGIYGLISSNIN